MNSGPYHFVGVQTASNQITMQSYLNSYESSGVVFGSLSSFGPKMLYVTLSDETISSYANGEVTQSDAAHGIEAYYFNELILGGIRSGAGLAGNLSGEIGELIMFNRKLKNSEREEIEDYLIQKWNLEV